jgi:hypothetical protein
MSTKPREWPNAAKFARDLAAETAVKGILALEPIVADDRPMPDAERLKREATALNCLQRIVRVLESVGASTRVNE